MDAVLAELLTEDRSDAPIKAKQAKASKGLSIHDGSSEPPPRSALSSGIEVSTESSDAPPATAAKRKGRLVLSDDEESSSPSKDAKRPRTSDVQAPGPSSAPVIPDPVPPQALSEGSWSSGRGPWVRPPPIE